MEESSQVAYSEELSSYDPVEYYFQSNGNVISIYEDESQQDIIS